MYIQQKTKPISDVPYCSMAYDLDSLFAVSVFWCLLLSLIQYISLI